MAEIQVALPRQLSSGVTEIFSNGSVFAALKNDGSDSDGDGVSDNIDLFPNYNDSLILNFISEYILRTIIFN